MASFTTNIRPYQMDSLALNYVNYSNDKENHREVSMDIPEEDLGEAGSKAAGSNTTTGRPGRYLKKKITRRTQTSRGRTYLMMKMRQRVSSCN